VKLKPFQVEDLARAAIHDGAILAWEQGLGKSLAAIAFPVIKDAQRTLIVAPGSLHKQLSASAARFFGRFLRPITSLDDFYRLGLHKPHKGPPRFYITTYTALGVNGADEWSETFGHKGEPKESKILNRRRRAFAKANRMKPNFSCIGETRGGITCVFSPTMARVANAHDSFDCVVVDEGTRLQASESRIGHSLRLLNPKYRLVLTGTPIKNRLESIFWLASWAAGPYGRWPYAPTDAARENFAETFLQSERFVGKERAAKERGQKISNTTRRSNRICSVHRLWKTLAPVIIRRRKADCGEDIPNKIVKPVIVAPGTSQHAVYRYHLDNPPLYGKNRKKPLHRRVQVGMQIGLLRQAALTPDATALGESFTGIEGPRKSWTDFSPKMAAILSIAQECMSRGRQVIIGSPFQEFSMRLHARFKEAGVSSLLLDGTTTPEHRGEMASEFKSGKHAILIAGLKAMGEGHSFENCSDLILPGLSYAFDENEQFIHRIWRLSSPGPVTIYPIIMKGSIDERLHEVFAEKADAASLALDGRLFTEPTQDIDLEWLLAETIKHFSASTETIDEQVLLAEWEKYGMHRLQVAHQQWGEHQTIDIDLDTSGAIATLKIPSPTQLTVDILRKHYKAGTYRKPTLSSLKSLNSKLRKKR
jgi:SNF2 family DNA or RNA helicase